MSFVLSLFGSALPLFAYYYDLGTTLRALTKIAFNTLAHYCPNSPINHQAFADVVRVIKGHAQVSPELIAANGFVHASDVGPIMADEKSHSFRLLHFDGDWHIYSSFFGGRIGAAIRFPGPNREDWCCADIVAPLRSTEWTIKTSSILQPLKVRIEWQDFSELVPSIEMLHTESKLQIERVTTKTATASTVRV